jgi:hypothetical protein
VLLKEQVEVAVDQGGWMCVCVLCVCVFRCVYCMRFSELLLKGGDAVRVRVDDSLW